MHHPWSLAYASFTRRALARLIDLVVVLAPCVLFYLINRVLCFPLRYTSLFNFVRPESATMFMSTDSPGIFLTYLSIKILIALPYFSLMDSSPRQGTLGKQLVGIKVTDLGGARISFGRATGRFFLKSASATLLMLGYVVNFSGQRQTWHDFIAGTLVLRKNISPAYYKLPRVQSRLMFDVLGFTTSTDAVPPSYVCVSCNFESDEKRVGCPMCGRPFGYVDLNALKALLLMNGIIFTLIGGVLAYLTISVANARLVDNSFGREGSPWGIIFVIFGAASGCLALGLSALAGRRWPIRLILNLAAGVGRR
jgi:uncharacterized RDD family membrane protein YckC